MINPLNNARAQRGCVGFAQRVGTTRLLAIVAAALGCLLVAFSGTQPAAANGDRQRSATRHHQQADLPVYDSAGRRRLARKLARARRADRQSARLQRRLTKRRFAASRRAGRNAPTSLAQLHQLRFAAALGMPVEGADAQSLRSGYTAFSGGPPEELGEWSSPIDPAEPASETDGINTPYDSSDLLSSARPPYPPALGTITDPWAQGVMWGMFPKVVPVFTALLPNGKVLYWDWKKSGSPGVDDNWPENTRVVLWDPVTGVAERSDPPFPANVFCAGYTHLPNGDLLLAGGNITSNQLGIDKTFIYHWQTDSWSQGPTMSRRRWYPSVAGMAAGDALILGGDPRSPGAPYNEPDPAMPEVFTSTFDAGAYDGGSLRPLSNLPYPGNNLAPRSHRVYPYLAPALDGRVLYAGPDEEMFMVDTEGAGGSEMFLSRDDVYREYGSFAWFDKGRVLVAGGGRNANFVLGPGPSFILPNTNEAFDHGAVASTALIDLLRDGGSETASPAQGLPDAEASGSMAAPRRMHNMTVLPDGTALTTGGMSTTDPDPTDCTAVSCPITNPSDQNHNNQLYNPEDATKTAELWNPATGAWTPLSAAAKVRQYHSVAMLMPDARVLTGGGGICGACTQQNYFEPNFEIFTPPYLFKQPGDPGYVTPGEPAPRPKITGPLTSGMLAPVGYGQQFTVDFLTDDGAGHGVSTTIDATTGSAVLMKAGAPTHGVDQGQRRVPLKVVSGAAGSVTLAAPPNAYEAPPGYYMLFLVDDRGVPSKSVMLQVGAQLALADVHAAATVYGAPALTGGSQVLGLGIFKATDGNLTDVGNNAIRSLKLTAGYKATVCTDSAGTDCAVVAPGDHPALGTAFDSKISYLRVEPDTGVTTDPRLTAIDGPGPTGPTGPTVPGPTEPGPPPITAPPALPATLAPTLKLAGALKLAPRLRIGFTCGTRCSASVKFAGGRRALTLGGRKSAKGGLTLDVASGRLTITLSKSSVRALRVALKQRRGVTVTVTLTDVEGRSVVKVARLR